MPKGHSSRSLQGLTISLLAACLVLATIPPPSVAASNIMTHSGVAQAQVAPSEGRIVFTSYRHGNVTDLYIMDADGSNQQRLTDTPAITEWHPSWSPDGTRIVFQCDREGGSGFNVCLINPDGSGYTQITNWEQEGSGAQRPVWSPDGGQIAVSRETGDWPHWIWAMNADGSGQRQLVEGRNPSWSPDGTRIAFERPVEVDGGRAELFTVNPDGKNLRQLTDLEGFVMYPTWSPDGRQIAFQVNDPYYIAIIGADGGEPQIVVNKRSWNLSWSSDGTQLVLAPPQQGIYTVNLDGSGLTKIAEEGVQPSWWGPKGVTKQAAPSPRLDATILQSSAPQISYIGQDGNVWLMNLDGRQQTPLTAANGSEVKGYDWSPDGRQLTYIMSKYDDALAAGRPEGNWYHDLHLLDLGTGEDSIVLPDSHFDRWDGIHWSPWGDRLAFGTSKGVKILDLSDNAIQTATAPQRLGRGAGSPPWNHQINWSSDGSVLAYEYVDGAQVIDVSGAAAIILEFTPEFSGRPLSDRYSFPLSSPTDQAMAWCAPDGTTELTDIHGIPLASFARASCGFSGGEWSPDGMSIADAGATGLHVVDAKTGQQETFLRDVGVWNSSWSSDGTRIVFTHVTGLGSEVFEAQTLGLLDLSTGQVTDLGVYGTMPQWRPRTGTSRTAPTELQGDLIRFRGTFTGAGCLSPQAPYPCYWDVEVSEQGLGPQLNDLVVVSGSTEECVPQHIDPNLEPGDYVEVYGKVISTLGTAWVCEGDLYLRKVNAQDSPQPFTLPELLQRKEAAISQLDDLTVHTSFLPDHPDLIDEKAAVDLVARLRDVSPGSLSERQIDAFGRAALQEEAVAQLLPIYIDIAENQSEVVVVILLVLLDTLGYLDEMLSFCEDAGPISSQTCYFLQNRISGRIAGLMGDIGQMLINQEDDPARRAELSKVWTRLIHWVSLGLGQGKAATEMLLDIPVRSELVKHYLTGYAGQIQPLLDQGIRSADPWYTGGAPTWTTEGTYEAADSHMWALKGLAAARADHANQLHADVMRAVDLGNLLGSLADTVFSPAGFYAKAAEVGTWIGKVGVDIWAGRENHAMMECAQYFSERAGSLAFDPAQPSEECPTKPWGLNIKIPRWSGSNAAYRIGQQIAAPLLFASWNPKSLPLLAGVGYQPAERSAAGQVEDYRMAVEALMEAARQPASAALDAALVDLLTADEALQRLGDHALVQYLNSDAATQDQPAAATALGAFDSYALAFHLQVASFIASVPEGADLAQLEDAANQLLESVDPFEEALEAAAVTATLVKPLPIVDSIVFSQPQTEDGQTLVSVSVLNLGAEAAREISLRLEIPDSGLVAETALADLQPGESAPVVFAPPDMEPGPVTAIAELSMGGLVVGSQVAFAQVGQPGQAPPTGEMPPRDMSQPEEESPGGQGQPATGDLNWRNQDTLVLAASLVAGGLGLMLLVVLAYTVLRRSL